MSVGWTPSPSSQTEAPASARAAGDERQVIISLSAAGDALRAAAARMAPEVTCSTGCAATEIDELKRRLEVLRRNLLDKA